MNKKISYVEFERKILINLVAKYKEIIESKKIDSATVYKKQQTWLKITNEYNRHQNVQKRLTKQLKRLWENIKAKAKKTHSLDLINRSHETSDTEELMDSSQTSTNISVTTGNESFEKIFGQTSSSVDGQQATEERLKRPVDEISTNDCVNDEEYLEQFLTPIVSARVKKVEEGILHQKELHSLSIQREQLQIRLLQDEISRQTELHSFKMDRERELYEMRINQEKDLHAKRMRNEDHLHQLKLAEYNKVQTPAYPIIYKQ